MDNYTITALIREHCSKLSHRFIGCFPCNTFPAITVGGKFQIVNTDPDSGAGRHWLLIGRYNDDKSNALFYFDSLDANANSYEDEHVDVIPYTCVKQRLRTLYHGTDVVKILKPLQFGISPQNFQTNTCGLYCIFMAHLLYLGRSVMYVSEQDIQQFAREHFGRDFDTVYL